MKISKSHPRYLSLKTREQIVKGVEKGITSKHGLLAHGRGEAFDYLIGEKTNDFAKEAINAASILLLLAKHPVISVNGNAGVLVGKKLVMLSILLNCPLEVNIFHSSKKRERLIRNYLLSKGAKDVFLPQKNSSISYLESNRKYVNPKGIKIADVIFVPLEDGDRAQALIKNGKKVITVDLNPLSRTSKASSITIVDNIVRVMPILIETIKGFKNSSHKDLKMSLKNFDNKKNLAKSLKIIKSHM